MTQVAFLRKRALGSGRTAYQVRWVDPLGVERSRQFRRLDDARTHKAKVEGQLSEGTYVDPARGKIRFGKYADQWLESRVARDSTLRVYERDLRLHIRPTLEGRPLNGIMRSDVQGLIAKLSQSYAPSKVKVVSAILSSIFQSAVLDGLIVRNPHQRITLPSSSRGHVIIPTVEQVYAVAGSVKGPYRGFIMAAAATGLRRNELLAVTRETSSLHMLRRRLTVRPDLGQLAEGPPRLVPPKSKASARTVPLGDVAIAAFTEHLRQYPANPDDGLGGRVFPYSTGAVARAIRPAMRDAGFPPGVGMHVFRHFYASALIHAGDSPKVVQVRLGHATIAETMDTYGHLWPDSEEQSRTAIDSVFTQSKQDEGKVK